MTRYFSQVIDNVTQVVVNEKTFSFFEWDEELMRLPLTVLSALIMHHENILFDLEDEKKPAKKYWSDGDTTIYTKVVNVRKLASPKYEESVNKKLLYILKAPVDVVLGARKFQELVLKATILNRIQKDHYSSCCQSYKLNSTKTIVFHNDGNFSVLNEDSPTYYQIQLNGLIELIMKRKEILADLDSPNSDENIYWVDETYDEEDDYMSEGFTLKTMSSENSRVFCLCLNCVTLDDSGEVIEIDEDHRLKKNIFELMLYIPLGAQGWKTGMNEEEKIKEARMLYWESTPFNIVKKIDFSADLQKFTISNDTYGVTLTMPTAALKAALERKVQILSDLESEKAPPNREKNYINEYWTDQTHGIRTGVLFNLFREIDCKVVKFVKVKDDECVFVAHKEAFLKLLETYQHRRRNSKRR